MLNQVELDKLRKKAGDALLDARKAAKKSQKEMARACGLAGNRAEQTAGAWERGEYAPPERRRRFFIHYLWNELRLKQKPEEFKRIWKSLEVGWCWSELTDEDLDELLSGRFIPPTLPEPVRQSPKTGSHTSEDENRNPTRDPVETVTIDIPQPDVVENPAQSASMTSEEETNPISHKPVETDPPDPSLPTVPKVDPRYRIWLSGVLLVIAVSALLWYGLKSNNPGPITPQATLAPVVVSTTPAQKLNNCHGGETENPFTIVITEFKEIGDNLSYENQLLDTLVKNNDLDGKVCQSDQEIDNSVAAKDFGREQGATIVIWGRRDKLALAVGVEVTDWAYSANTQPKWPADIASSYEFQVETFPIMMKLFVDLALSEIDDLAGRLAQSRGRVDNSLKAVELKPEVVISNAAKIAQIYFWLGNQFSKSADDTPSDYQQGIIAYQRALNLDPTLLYIHVLIGRNYLQSGDIAKAETYYSELINSNTLNDDPITNAIVYSQRANIFEQEKQYAKAKEDIHRALIISPNNIFYEQLGLLQIRTGEINGAKATYQLARCWIFTQYNGEDRKESIDNAVNRLLSMSKDKQIPSDISEQIIKILQADEPPRNC